MNKAIFITVRTGSTRLPKKCLLEINGKKNIEFLIGRVKKSKKADIIVLCTTILPEDDVLVDIANRLEIESFRGSVKDKLERWKGATQKYNVDFFVTVDGDDLFCEPELIDLAFEQYERNNPDFIEEKPGVNVSTGAFTYGIKVKALNKVCETKTSTNTEMIDKYFQNLPFKIEELENIPEELKRPEIRMTLDYEEDFLFFKTIIEAFEEREFNLYDVIDYLDKNPLVIEINKSCQEKYLENQKK